MATATADVVSSRCPWLVQLNYGGLRPHFHEAIWSSIESVDSRTLSTSYGGLRPLFHETIWSQQVVVVDDISDPILPVIIITHLLFVSPEEASTVADEAASSSAAAAAAAAT